MQSLSNAAGRSCEERHDFFFFFQAEDGIRDYKVTGVQTCALPICGRYYDLEVGEGRQWGMWRREQDHWVDLKVFTPADAVRPPGETNELVARAVDRKSVV